MVISVGVPNSILRQSAMAQMIIPIHPFLLDVLLYVLHQLMQTHRDPGGKPSGARVYYPPLRFLQSTLDDLGHNRYGPMPTLQATWLQSVPTQGCQECRVSLRCLLVPAGDTVLLTKANTIITVEGSRLPPGDMLDVSQPTRVRHQPHEGLW